MTPQQKQAHREAARDAWIKDHTEPKKPVKAKPVKVDETTEEKPASKFTPKVADKK